MPTRPRAARICCLDLDTFFVSVERLLNPELCGKPVVIGATPGRRGVVTACSYEVRTFGVRSGMPIARAYKLAPHAIYLPTRHSEYSPYAKQVRAVLDRYTPIVRTASIDEFFLDLSGCEMLYRRDGDRDGDATIHRVATEMRERIQAEVGLPASIGIGVTRTVAKIASGLAKPAGVRMIDAGDELAQLSELPVRKYPGIGPVAERRLHDAGIYTLQQLLKLAPGRARARFGSLSDGVLRGLTGRGRLHLSRDRPAFLEHDRAGETVGSISNERTFGADVGDVHTVEKQLRTLAERVCWRARQRQVRARTVTLKLRYADFHTITRSHTMPATNREFTVYRCVHQLMHAALTRPLPVRLLGVALTNFVSSTGQLDLPMGVRYRPDVGGAIDAVRDQFGYDAIRLGEAGGKSRWLA